MALFKHKLTGEIIDAPAHYALNPVLGKNLIPVDAEVLPKAEKKRKKEAPVAIPVEVEAEEGETPTIETNEE